MVDAYVKYPKGYLRIIGSDEGISEIIFVDRKEHDDMPSCLMKCVIQLNEYFNGERSSFDIKLDYKYGTEFQKKVWNILKSIPYGETRTYKDIATDAGSPKGFRAVGSANNKNRIPIIIPCHRVIGSNKKLVGFAGGLDIKSFLLKHEGINL